MKFHVPFATRELVQMIGGTAFLERELHEAHQHHEQLVRLHALPAMSDLFLTLESLECVQQERNRIVDSCRRQIDWSQSQRLSQEALGSLTSGVEAARLAGSLYLPDMLDAYGVSDHTLATSLADAHRMPWWDDSHIASLNSHRALSGMFNTIDFVGRDAWRAVEMVLSEPLIGIESVRCTREFLEISGLLRFPRFRVLTMQEKRRRVKQLFLDNGLPVPVKKAHALVHRNEKVLRVLIARCMEDAYGEDWPQARLPLCDCKKLLGKSLEEDECVLDHADYKHYELIMCHEDHFAALFSQGYADVGVLRGMLVRLGQLRAQSHHGRTFTAEHFQELTVLWRTMEAGFVGLMHDVVQDV